MTFTKTLPSEMPRILVLRGEAVILDDDLAGLYGVATRVLNQAVKRNSARFPSDFAFHLTAEDWKDVRSQLPAKSTQPKSGSCLGRKNAQEAQKQRAKRW